MPAASQAAEISMNQNERDIRRKLRTFNDPDFAGE